MQHYFQIQYKILNRQITEFGLHPIAAHILIPLAFVGLSILLFYKTTLAPYIYVLFALANVARLSERRRNEFLQSLFPEKNYQQVRLLENNLIILPFVLFLCFAYLFWFALGLFILGNILALINFSNRWKYSLPTPFSKHPFEFAIGFRNTWPIILLAYFLTYMGIRVDNFELGAFSLIIIFLTSLSYYSKPESIFFVWIFKTTPERFLLRKLGTALLHFGILCLPILIGLGFYYPTQVGTLISVLVLVSIYLITFILAKYSSFPRPNALPESLIFGTCFVFPPILLGIIPYFYRRSIQKLKTVLA